jgi:hypothetical protein
MTLTLALSLLACGKAPADSADPVATIGDGALVASVEVLDFGTLDLTEALSSSAIVTLTNEGHASVAIDSASATGGFSAEATAAVLEPGESAELEVVFEPDSWGDFEGELELRFSGAENLTLALTGLALAPEIALSPESLDFGEVTIGCEVSELLTIDNLGNAPLVIDALDLAAGSSELSLDPNTASNGPLSWTLDPDDAPLEVFVDYAPDATSDTISYLTVDSNDPFSPRVTASQAGAGRSDGRQQDSFTQEASGPLDILIAVNDDASMSEVLANLQANFDTMLATLSALAADYRVGLVTADDGCVAGAVNYVDSAMSSHEQQAALDDMLAGPASSDPPATFQRALNALASAAGGSGGCNEGLLREGARLSLLSVSDVAEGSPNSWDYYVSVFRGLKYDADDLVVSAIAGDYPAGCGDAEPGLGYYEAIEETDGIFLSVCGTDFGAYLQAFAEVSAAPPRRFPLSEIPDPDTLSVTVDGSPAGGWSYDAASNSVIFSLSAAPAEGAQLILGYELAPECAP